MATIPVSQNEKVFSIKKWLGINECPDGDTNLKYGEAAVMQNFKITDNGSLQIRPGSKNIAGLVSSHSVVVSTETTTLLTELSASTKTYSMYPDVSISDAGILSVTGTPVSVTYSNRATYVGYYYQDSNGNVFKFANCTYTAATGGTHVTGGTVNFDTEAYVYGVNNPISAYNGLTVSGGSVYVSGASQNVTAPTSEYKYADYGTKGVYEVTGELIFTTFGWGHLAKKVLYAASDTYTWNFYAVTLGTASSDTQVRGVWYGKVGSTYSLIAACNGRLWRLVKSGTTWTKTDIGTITTTNGNVHMFGFDGKLYILDGSEYKSWDGSSLSVVTGYRPLILVAAAPAGGGTALEQINKLNGLRRVQFSSTGGTTFQLPETGLASIDYVKYVATGASISTASLNTSTGLVTTSASTTAGTSNIEIGYTASTNYRSQVIAMRFSEIYNGETDNRVFLYGDGSNKAFYSGIRYDTGKPTAEYFPDLNEIAVDSANSPITSMIKHYDSLLTFKSDGAFITNYGSITLTDNTTTAAFYTTPLNRELGNIAVGQSQLVGNNPFTLYGRSVYEWKLSSYAAKDERNAKKISDRVNTTLSNMDLTSAICFDDNFHTEYYIVQNNKAVVYNYSVNAWYIYENFPATCMINYEQDVYFGTPDGYIRHLSRDYMNDVGENIVAYWQSGAMSFGADYKLKSSPCLWIGIKPEAYGAIDVTVQTDKQNDYSTEDVLTNYTEGVASGFFSFFDLDFTRFSFNINSKPQMNKLKIKVKKFVYYYLIFASNSNNTTATVTSADVNVLYSSNVK